MTPTETDNTYDKDEIKFLRRQVLNREAIVRELWGKAKKHFVKDEYEYFYELLKGEGVIE